MSDEFVTQRTLYAAQRQLSIESIFNLKQKK